MRLPFRTSLTLASLISTLALADLSHAQSSEGGSCLTAADCESGLDCQVVGAIACAAPACPDGQTCEVPACEPVDLRACVRPPCSVDADCGPGMLCQTSTLTACPDCDPAAGAACPSECTSSEATACVPKPCTTDAECEDAGLVCIVQKWAACSGSTPACAPGEECAPPPEPTCITQSVSFCGPRYMDECAVDADCGDGFRCVPQQSCACSGGGVARPAPGAAGASSSEPVPEPVEECTCTATGTNYCEPQIIECATAADCPADWLCTPSPAPAIACAPNTVCEPTEPAPSTCTPPAWGGIAYRGVATSGEPVYAPGTGYESVGLTPTPAENDATDEGGGAEAKSTAGGGGCQLGAAPVGSAAASWLLLGGLLVARRRRRAADG